MRSEDIWQAILIFLGVIATALLSVFLLREIYPEYRIYQDAFVSIEDFRSSYTGQKPAPFRVGIKQIVIPSETNGPPVIDRCISCHVALEIPDYGPTKIAQDINGNIVVDEKGWPVQIPNDNYIWKKLDEKIAYLKDEKEIQKLLNKGETHVAEKRLKEAEKLNSLKTSHVGEHKYDMKKVLSMHPLIGKETHPFEFHPLDSYGCVICHNGNGRGLVTDRAHGAIYDGDYEITYEGVKPHFLEKDTNNDPLFSKAYNEVPGERLVFQTTPLFVGKAIEAKCVQCHLPTVARFNSALSNIDMMTERLANQDKQIENSFKQEKEVLKAILEIRKNIKLNGYSKTLEKLEKQSNNYLIPKDKLNDFKSQLDHLKKMGEEHTIEELDRELIRLVGSIDTANQLEQQLDESKEANFLEALNKLNTENPQKGSLFEKINVLEKNKNLRRQINQTQTTLASEVLNPNTLPSLVTDIDLVTKSYQRGQELFMNQACYVCHRISGFARGGVGPDLTKEGLKEPWFIKESIVWPQADLRTSTMPNQKLDHEEVESLVTYLLGQLGENKAVSEANYLESVKAWEAGKKLPWEKAITPSEIFDLRAPMIVFATQGCAGCHRLKGFESNVGFTIEKEKKEVSFEELYKQHEWFKNIFPEEIFGSRIVENIEKYKDEIDERLSSDVRKGAILEEIEKIYPKTLEAYYSNFKYALRAKNSENDTKVIEDWKKRVYKVMMMYIQEYGLGHLIGPRLNWSGIFRSDEWLMEHFWNPSLHTPRTIMPIFPFDDTKFLSLTYMLDQLALKNTKNLREVWEKRGFNPETVVNTLCSQCHGEFLHGDGPVAEWIYPIPKNLRNPVFLHSLTRERVIQSITHGVKGTPMPPWGEIAKDKLIKVKNPVLREDEIEQIADWLFNTLPGENIIESEEVSKWRYMPEDFLKELKNEEGIEQLLPQYLEGTPSKTKVLTLPLSFQPILAAASDLKVDDFFDVKPNPLTGAEKDSFYIKKMFYTTQNLRAGEDLFVLNCSVCHGKDADGSGIRAASMAEAKPRMLTNLDWLKMRDDLRLLRSIKYGVPGTSMIPWGDFTNALQRMQLVMYIRSLSESQTERETFSEVLYQAFDTSIWDIEKARLDAYQILGKTQREYEAIKSERQRKDKDSKTLLNLYEKELSLEKELNQEIEKDKKYLELINKIKQEKVLYTDLGRNILAIDDDALNANFIALVLLSKIRFQEENFELPNSKEIKNVAQNMLKELEKKKSNSQNEKEIKNIELLKNQIIATLAESKRLTEDQKKIWNELTQEEKKDEK